MPQLSKVPVAVWFLSKHLEVFSPCEFVQHLSRRFEIYELGFNLNQTIISLLCFLQFSRALLSKDLKVQWQERFFTHLQLLGTRTGKAVSTVGSRLCKALPNTGPAYTGALPVARCDSFRVIPNGCLLEERCGDVYALELKRSKWFAHISKSSRADFYHQTSDSIFCCCFSWGGGIAQYCQPGPWVNSCLCPRTIQLL